MEKEMVNHPSHYGGKGNKYEAIKVIEAWRLGFNLGNAVKYISRIGKKDEVLQELGKIRWYFCRHMENLSKGVIMTPNKSNTVDDYDDVELIIEAWKLNDSIGTILSFIYRIRFHEYDAHLINETLELIDDEIEKTK